MKCCLKYIQACLNGSIGVIKLRNTQKKSYVYWYLLKAFSNNRNIPIIPPLLYENCFVTDFREKADFFDFFSKQCFLILNNISHPSYVKYITDKCLSIITPLTEESVQNFNSNKAHAFDRISICMLKICRKKNE